MIEVYSWSTPNGVKVHIMLEEVGLPYTVRGIDIGAGDQFAPAYLKLNPNNKVPTIVDRDGPSGKPFTVFESGAILFYLAEKTGRFLPAAPEARHTVMQWLMFQVGGVGPMLGQCHHFRHYAPEPIPYAVDRYGQEAARLYRVLEHRLAQASYLAGDYSIADIATWPWVHRFPRQGIDLSEYPNVERWYRTIHERPAVQAGLKVLAKERIDFAQDTKARDVLFGATQYRRR